MDRQCSSCGGFCKKSRCEIITLKPITGSNIKRIREARKMSAIELARAASVPKNTLSELENSTQNPSVWTMYKIAKALNCSIEELLRYQSLPD
jgi:transcriptional regulator with XRE-family HTH domain